MLFERREKVRKHFLAILLLVAFGVFASCSSEGGSDTGISDGSDGDESGKIGAYIVRIDGKEVGYLSDASEIVRLEALLAENKLDELKAQNTEVAHTVVAIKGELEKIREQIQNIE